MLRNTTDSYGWLHKLIHWVSALAILVLFGVGLWIERLDYYSPWYQTVPKIHIGMGFILIVVTLFRLYWRWRVGAPAALLTHRRWEQVAAKTVHWFFYIAIFSMFVSGYIVATIKGQSMPVFGLFSIPAIVTEASAPWLKGVAHNVHELLAFTIIGIATVHALAALKHHTIDKDNTLRRMMR